MVAAIFLLTVLVTLLCFAAPGFLGAPYVPTLKKYISISLDLLDLAPGQTMIELGCGDGSVVLAAAKRGYRVVGYEINPYLAAIAWFRTLRYRKQVTIIWGNLFKKELHPADGIYCFIMPKFMPDIDRKIIDSKLAPIKLVSFSMPIPAKQPVKQKDNVLLYQYS